MGVSTSKPHDIKTKWFNDFEKTLPSLENKVFAVTGCTSGTGLVAAKALAMKEKTTVLMLNRESDRATSAEAAVKEVASSTSVVETIPCDLQSFESVKTAAATIKEKHPAINVLCNNAGVMALDDYATVDGYDVQMQTNHLSHFLLTNELFPCLKKAGEDCGEPSRVVNHSSLARSGTKLEEKYFGKNGGNLGGNSSIGFNGARWERYGQTKCANAVFTQVLADKLKENGLDNKVISTVAAPGLATTNLQVTTAQNGGMGIASMGVMRFAHSAEDGTMPLLTAMVLPADNGDFFEPCQRQRMIGPVKKFELEENCVNEDAKKLLWETSEAACGKFNF